jgi:hypothetical protein
MAFDHPFKIRFHRPPRNGGVNFGDGIRIIGLQASYVKIFHGQIPYRLEKLIGSDDFDLMTDPVGRKIHPAAVATGFDPLFDHLFAVYFKLHLAIRCVSSGIFFVLNRFLILIFCVGHCEMPLLLRWLCQKACLGFLYGR